MAARVLIPLAKGFEETEAVAVVDVLRRAGVEVVTAALDEGPVESAHAVKVLADARLDDVADDTFDAVVLPGGLEGTANLAASETLRRVLARHAAEGRVTAAICAAPTVLARHGLLDGRRATCHFSKAAELSRARFVEDAVVEDGPIVTSRGVGTALAFGLALVERLVGREKADAIARSIHFER
jgi:4-methyl-5(b-hydroxyethyl)-thiazole monophosphate biosynthesis